MLRVASLRHLSHVGSQSNVRKVVPDHFRFFESHCSIKGEEVLVKQLFDIFSSVVGQNGIGFVLRLATHLFLQLLNLLSPQVAQLGNLLRLDSKLIKQLFHGVHCPLSQLV